MFEQPAAWVAGQLRHKVEANEILCPAIEYRVALRRVRTGKAGRQQRPRPETAFAGAPQIFSLQETHTSDAALAATTPFEYWEQPIKGRQRSATERGRC